jgi:hypothetical protein
MDKEAWRTISYVLVGVVAALVSTGIDKGLRADTSQEALIGLILLSVAVLGYAGTYVAEYFGTNVEEAGGRLRVYLKSLFIYIVTWFVLYTILFNEIIFFT